MVAAKAREKKDSGMGNSMGPAGEASGRRRERIKERDVPREEEATGRRVWRQP